MFLKVVLNLQSPPVLTEEGLNHTNSIFKGKENTKDIKEGLRKTPSVSQSLFKQKQF